MKNFLPVILKDAYKIGHPAQYPRDTTLVYSNFTPRGSRVVGVDGVIAFGFQYFVEEYLVRQFNEGFFDLDRGEVLRQYKRRVDNMLGPGTNVNHIGELHEQGFLPLHIKAVPEGTLVPFRVPILTIRNTEPEFFWLTNMVETLLSNVLWMPCTSATTAFNYRRVFEAYAKQTGADREFVKWQGHDFSMRGLSGLEAACLSGAGHLLSFTGTDTVPAIDFLEEYYGANSDVELIGGSVPATEHSVICMGEKAGELETIQRLISQVYPRGIVSIVSDTWDFWRVLTEYLPKLRETILARDGSAGPAKVVIRPDSGDPVAIICGSLKREDPEHVQKGAIRLLWEVFGGTVNDIGYKVLDSHIGLIYGDSITSDRQQEILQRLMLNGFASSNVVLGIGSYTYQYVTRDTYGFAMKATYGETKRGPQNIWKDPATDDGVKKSAKGLLRVDAGGYQKVNDKRLELPTVREECIWSEETGGLLQTVFVDGIAANIQSLVQIRARVEAQL